MMFSWTARGEGRVGQLEVQTEGKSRQRVDEAHLRRRIHEIELEGVLDSERLEEKDGVGEVRPLDLGDVVWEHLVDVGHLGEESIAEPVMIQEESASQGSREKEFVDSPASGSTSSTRSLTSVGLTDGSDLESVHSDFRIVHLEFRVSSIDDVEDSID
jgi:hypothetical protein